MSALVSANGRFAAATAAGICVGNGIFSLSRHWQLRASDPSISMSSLLTAEWTVALGSFYAPLQGGPQDTHVLQS